MVSMADLPEDILRVIKSKLCLSDLVKFSAVCKRWRLLGNPGNSVLAMAYLSADTKAYFWADTRIFTCKLYECGTRIHTTVFTTEQGWPSYYYNFIGVCAAKMGWLIIVDYIDPSGLAVLCNPFSKRVLSLPRLGHQIDMATFSTIPTSPECIIFVLYQTSSGKTRLGTCEIGDEGWRRLTVAEREAYPAVMSVVYLEGKLYCVFGDGMLGCYNVEEENWTILIESFPEQIPLDNLVCFFMVESERKILVATCSVEVGGDECYLLRFDVDQPQRAWIGETSLGMRTWFAGPTSFLVSAVDADLCDCICYFDDGPCGLMVYSFKDQQWRDLDFRPDINFRWMDYEENNAHNIEDDEVNFKYDDDNDVDSNEDEEMKRFYWRVWIEGPSV